MAKEFADKIALVTGGASGIGKATAEAFAQQGAHVVIADFNRAGGDAVVKGINGSGGRATYQYCDVREKESVDALFAFIRNTFGKLNCAVNNAGIDPEIHMGAPPNLGLFDAIHATNVRGVFMCLDAETQLMSRNGGGTIVNLSSFAGTNGIAFKPAYVAAKHAVLGMTRAMALHFVSEGIRINAVCPGPVDTPMMHANVRPENAKPGGSVPLGRVAAPREMADIILWLCSDRSSYVVGQGIAGDGGMTA
jgi:NAD(P)-dependent dehydrogenase (short-subunit alcohol dehydrogenase family)